MGHYNGTIKMVPVRCLLLHCVVASGRAGAASSCSCGTPPVGCATLADMLLYRMLLLAALELLQAAVAGHPWWGVQLLRTCFWRVGSWLCLERTFRKTNLCWCK